MFLVDSVIINWSRTGFDDYIFAFPEIIYIFVTTNQIFLPIKVV